MRQHALKDAWKSREKEIRKILKSDIKLDNIRLAALDLDGTVLTNDKRVALRTRTAIQCAAECGVEVVYVTGRPFFGIPEAVLSIEGSRYIISSNGAVITDISSGGAAIDDIANNGALSIDVSGGRSFKRHKVYSALLERRTASEIVKLALQRGILYSVYMDGMGYCEQNSFDGRLKPYEGGPIGDYIHQSVRITSDILDYIQRFDAAPENIWLQEKDTDSRDRLCELIKSNWNVKMVLTSPTDIEIVSPLAGKGRTLCWLSEKLGLQKEQILAIGDNFNDLEMFEAAGTSVAMGNAPAEMKASAGFVCPSNEEDGVAFVLEKVPGSSNNL